MILHSKVFLESISGTWRFTSEAALEDFVWENLSSLFNWLPLKRQYWCSGEACDILAIAPDGQLVILELKNAEDRYIIQQLTRYYANLIEEKPFQEQVNYDIPVRLVAIAPSYHRHNLIDQQYSTLESELWQFTFEAAETQPLLCLSCLNSDVVLKHPIPQQEVTIPVLADVAPPSAKLLSWLSTCTLQEQEGFLSIRAALLSRGKRIQEWEEGNWIRYGSGKTKLAAEFGYRPNLRKLILFVWLTTPNTAIAISHPNFRKKIVTGRLRLWTDGATLSEIGHVPEGYGTMRTEKEWQEVPPAKRPTLNWSSSHKSKLPVNFKGYASHWQMETSDMWKFLTECLLRHWNERV